MNNQFDPREPIETAEGKVFKKANNLLTRRIGLIGVAGVSLAYMFWGLIEPELSGKSVLEIILSSGITMLVAYGIDSLLRLQGILTGALDPIVVEAKRTHVETALTANDYSPYADDWAEIENAIVLRTARTHILTSASLRYIDYFDEEGNMKDVDIPIPPKGSPKHVKARYKEKITALDKAVKFKVTPVTMAKLSAESSASLDYNDTGMEPDEYQKVMAKRALFMKLVTAGIFGQFVLNVATGDAWAGFYYGLIQVVVFLVFGLISYYLSFTYMTVTYVSGLRKKVTLLLKLITYGKKRRAEELLKADTGVELNE